MAVVRELITLLRFQSEGIQQAQAGMMRLQGLAQTLVATLAGMGVAFSVKGLAEAGDAMTGHMNQLRSVLKDTGAVAGDVYERLYSISKETGVAVDASVSGFTQMQGAVKDMGGTADQVSSVIEGMQMAGIIAGSKTADVAETVRQMGQALGQGTLNGDELRILMERMAPLGRAIAKELGVSAGALKKMGTDGKLTNDKLWPALLRASAGFRADFEKMTPTMSRSLQQVRVVWERFLADLDQNLGLSQRIARNLQGISSWLENFRQYVPIVGVLVTQFGGLDAILRPVGFGLAAAAAGFVAVNSAMLVTALRLAAIPLAILGIGVVLEELWVWLHGGQSELTHWIGPAEPILAAAGAMRGVGDAMRLVQSVFNENTGMVATTVREFKQLADAAIAAGPSIASAWTATQTFFAGVDTTISEGVRRFRAWCDEEETKFGQVVTAIGNNFRGLGGEGTKFAEDMARAAQTVDSAWNGLKGMFKGLFDWWMKDWEEGLKNFAPLWDRFQKALPQNPGNLPNIGNPSGDYFSPSSYGQSLIPRMGMPATQASVVSTINAPVTVNATGVSGAEVAAATQSGMGHALRASPFSGDGLARAIGVASPRVEAAAA